MALESVFVCFVVFLFAKKPRVSGGVQGVKVGVSASLGKH